MEYIILNEFTYTLENLSNNKILVVKEILSPKRAVVMVSKGKIGYAEDRTQRSRYEETLAYSHVDVSKGQIAKDSPLGKAILKYERTQSESAIIAFSNEKGKRLTLHIKDKHKRQNNIK